MVTDIVQSISYDALSVAASNDFLSKKKDDRQKLLTKQLASYPAAIKVYLESVSEEQFVQDLTAVIEEVQSSGSIMASALRLEQSKNQFFESILGSLAELKRVEGDSSLAKTVASFREAGGTFETILDRELQTLLLFSKGEDSPIIQLAAEEAIDTSPLSGVPSVTVNKSLLGGARMFHNGTLEDRSWRARLTRILSAIS